MPVFSAPFYAPDPEIELVLLMSIPEPRPSEVDRMRELLHAPLEYNRVFGMLFTHRTAGMAWVNVQRHFDGERHAMRPSYFFKALEVLFNGQRATAAEQIGYNTHVANAFAARGIPCAVLKGGAMAHMGYRTLGVRTFHDNDFLFDREQLADVGRVLAGLGYSQGSWDRTRKVVVPASRRELLFFAMNSHQTYAYVMPTPDAQMLERHLVDVHFSVDLMNGARTDEVVRDLLSCRVTVGGDVKTGLPSLHPDDAFIFNCVHFQREAVYHDEVVRLKDLVLYKLMDLLAMIDHPQHPVDMKRIVDRAHELGLTREVYFSLHYLDGLYPGRLKKEVLAALAPSSLEYLDQVLGGKGVVHTWTTPVVERFFNPRRVLELGR